MNELSLGLAVKRTPPCIRAFRPFPGFNAAIQTRASFFVTKIELRRSPVGFIKFYRYIVFQYPVIGAFTVFFFRKLDMRLNISGWPINAGKINFPVALHQRLEQGLAILDRVQQIQSKSKIKRRL